MNLTCASSLQGEQRLDKMDHFFESLASLMSNLLRSTVENSITDMLDLLEEYHEGNEYTGTYDVMVTSLAHPQKIHPVKFFLVNTRASLFRCS